MTATLKATSADTAGPSGAQHQHRAWLARGEFRLPRCTACGGLHFPPRMICPACGRTGFEWIRATGRGVLQSATVVRRPAAAGGDHPVCLIDQAEGPRLMSRVEGVPAAALRIGMPVVARIAPDGHGAPVLVFDAAVDPS